MVFGTPGDLTWLVDFLTSKSRLLYWDGADTVQKCMKICNFSVDLFKNLGA